MVHQLKAIVYIIVDWIKYIAWFLVNLLKSEAEKNLENVALRSQLALFQQQIINKKTLKPHCSSAFKQLWVILSRFYGNWKSTLVIVKPETVITWHNKAFKVFWRFKSRKKSGRNPISQEIIKKIKIFHEENPLLSPEKIYERLINLNIKGVPCANTIAKYIPKTRKPPSDKQIQSWKTFLKNHKSKIWAIDCFVVPTLFFKVLHVFVVISHDRRKIEHIAVTQNPNTAWMIQQMREATPFGRTPDYIIHDNDPLFRSKDFQAFLKSSNIKSKRTGVKSPWQNGIVERTIGILRQELVNHIIPKDENHLRKLLLEFVGKYYNPIRTHQGIKYETPIPSEKLQETTLSKTILIGEPILNGLYHSYKKVA